jgi:hypothetical protein
MTHVCYFSPASQHLMAAGAPNELFRRCAFLFRTSLNHNQPLQIAPRTFCAKHSRLQFGLGGISH